MKKVVLTLLAASLTITAAMSQTSVRVDKDAILKKIDKSDEDIANPKKNIKPAVWLDRGKVFHDAATASWTGLYRGISFPEVGILYGTKAEGGAKTINGAELLVYDYPNFEAYFGDDASLVYWVPKLTVVDNAYEESFKAYSKAYEVDPKSASKVKPALETLANDHKKEGENAFARQDFGQTAEHFAQAFEIQMHPALAVLDTVSQYNAGMFYTFAGDYAKGAKYLEGALKNQYESDGDVYYFLYHDYYGLGDNNKAKDILEEGISKYPGNTKIVEGLVGIYSITDSDPRAIIDIVKQSIEVEPDNHLLWSGLGSIYQKMEDNDGAISSYSRAVELAPNDFFNNFRLAFAYIEIGDEYNKRLNELNPSSSEDYNKALEEVYAEYEKALVPLEKAHQIDPSSEATVELLKNLTFRLRDRSDSILEKYNHYNELYKRNQGE